MTITDIVDCSFGVMQFNDTRIEVPYISINENRFDELMAHKMKVSEYYDKHVFDISINIDKSDKKFNVIFVLERYGSFEKDGFVIDGVENYKMLEACKNSEIFIISTPDYSRKIFMTPPKQRDVMIMLNDIKGWLSGSKK